MCFIERTYTAATHAHLLRFFLLIVCLLCALFFNLYIIFDEFELANFEIYAVSMHKCVCVFARASMRQRRDAFIRLKAYKYRLRFIVVVSLCLSRGVCECECECVLLFSLLFHFSLVCVFVCLLVVVIRLVLRYVHLFAYDKCATEFLSDKLYLYLNAIRFITMIIEIFSFRLLSIYYFVDHPKI